MEAAIHSTPVGQFCSPQSVGLVPVPLFLNTLAVFVGSATNRPSKKSSDERVTVMYTLLRLASLHRRRGGTLFPTGRRLLPPPPP